MKQVTYPLNVQMVRFINCILLGHHFKPLIQDVNPVLHAYSLPFLAWYEPSQLQYTIHWTFLCLSPNLSQGDKKLFGDISTDPHTEKAFSLNNKSTILAICLSPICHFIYKPTYKPTFQADLPVPIYSDKCNYHEFPGGEKCGIQRLIK